MEYMNNLSKNLRALRGEKTLMAFATELGITKSTLQAIEKGSSVVRLDTLEIICKRSGIPVKALLADEVSPEEVSLLWQVLRNLNWFTTLPEKEQKELLDWAGKTLKLFSRLSMKL